MHKDVDHLMIYDAPCSLPGASFAHLPIYGLENLGFVGRGEGGPFIAERHTAPRRQAAAQHQWRRRFLHVFRHVRHVRPTQIGSWRPHGADDTNDRYRTTGNVLYKPRYTQRIPFHNKS
jgi:hypothetical protein